MTGREALRQANFFCDGCFLPNGAEPAIYCEYPELILLFYIANYFDINLDAAWERVVRMDFREDYILSCLLDVEMLETQEYLLVYPGISLTALVAYIEA